MPPVIITEVNSFNINGQPVSQAMLVSDKQLEYILKALSFVDWCDGGKVDEMHSNIANAIELHLVNKQQFNPLAHEQTK